MRENRHFHKGLEKIKKMILSLGALVEERVHMASQSVEKRDREMAQTVIRSDFEIDEMEVEIEEECLKSIALYQPVAGDLRFLVAIIKINNELERIGDQAVNIAQRMLRVAKETPCEINFDYSLMAQKVEYMLKQSLDALVKMDVDIALKICLMDDEIDQYRRDAYDYIKDAMYNNIDHLGYLINLLLISRHLERLADHTTNIAEEVIYMIEGEIVRHSKELK